MIAPKGSLAAPFGELAAKAFAKNSFSLVLVQVGLLSPAGDPLSHFAVREEQGLRPGGFGLLLAQKQVGDLLYNEKGNEVLLIKYINAPASQTGS